MSRTLSPNPLFPWKNTEYDFSYRAEPLCTKNIADQKGFIAWCHSLTTGKEALQQRQTNTDTIKLNITLSANWAKRNKEAVSSARGDYSSLDDFRDISNFSLHFKIFIYLCHDFLRNP
jgi:hypothetical protein